jgi:predicted nucleic-acid-binding protein
MNIIVDTNILVRIVVADDQQQAQVSARLLQEARTIVVSIVCLCELVWVLGRVYKIDSESIATVLRELLGTANVVVDRAAVEAGVALLEAGGDFADGVIAFDARRHGGETFVSFDRTAVDRLTAQGVPARLLS